MRNTLKFLTQIQPPRNHKNVDSLNKVAEYIKQRFAGYNLEVNFQEFTVDEKIYKNVIATLNPHYTKRLIVGGHYDVCGDFEGADDNASAVAGVIQTAKKLVEIKDKIPFRIDFVCFTLEEPPYFGTDTMGSYQYVKYLHENRIDVMGMINYEMIGYFTDENVSISEFESFITKKDADITKENFIAIISDEKSDEFMNQFCFSNINKKIDHIEAMIPSPINFVTASDHLNFWKFGYKAIMVTDTAHLRNPNYHTKNDTLETLNIEKMEDVIELIIEGIKHFIVHDLKKDDIPL
jgi:Zn-dependent M28 family amino/carboxypeptidase